MSGNETSRSTTSEPPIQPTCKGSASVVDVSAASVVVLELLVVVARAVLVSAVLVDGLVDVLIDELVVTVVVMVVVAVVRSDVGAVLGPTVASSAAQATPPARATATRARVRIPSTYGTRATGRYRVLATTMP